MNSSSHSAPKPALDVAGARFGLLDDYSNIGGEVQDLNRPSTGCRVAVGRLWQETNCFSQIPTVAEDFIVYRGADLVTAFTGSQTVLGGILHTLSSAGYEILPTLSASARPGGPIDWAFVETLIEEFVAGVVSAKPDAVCIELHGSMVGEGLDDVEGRLLSMLRHELGPNMPIVVGLDLHAHVTEDMFLNADFLAGYRTQPHEDMYQTGVRAAIALRWMLGKRSRPVGARLSYPFLALGNDETKDAPLQQFWAQALTIADKTPDLFDISIFNVHPFLDLPGMGQVVLAYSLDSRSTANEVCRALGEELESLKYLFRSNTPSAQEVLADLAARHRQDSSMKACLVIGDQGDSVLAGTPGDSVEIAIEAHANFADLRGLLLVYDPDAVEKAVEAGAGQSINIALGGNFTPGLRSLALRFEVERLTDGVVTNEGRYMQGIANQLGTCAVLRHGSRVFLATSRAPSVCDPALAAHAGYRLEDFDYLVVKAGNHHKISFAGISPSLAAGTPGMASRDPATLRHVRARPIFPADQV